MTDTTLGFIGMGWFALGWAPLGIFNNLYYWEDEGKDMLIKMALLAFLWFIPSGTLFAIYGSNVK